MSVDDTVRLNEKERMYSFVSTKLRDPKIKIKNYATLAQDGLNAPTTQITAHYKIIHENLSIKMHVRSSYIERDRHGKLEGDVVYIPLNSKRPDNILHFFLTPNQLSSNVGRYSRS